MRKLLPQLLSQGQDQGSSSKSASPKAALTDFAVQPGRRFAEVGTWFAANQIRKTYLARVRGCFEQLLKGPAKAELLDEACAYRL